MVGGSEFGFLAVGEGKDSVPVLLLHATGETSESWMHFLSRWGRRGGLAYALDLRGHGRSVWSGPYGLETFADEIGLLARKPRDIAARSRQACH